jgi:hypothetical protein
MGPSPATIDDTALQAPEPTRPASVLGPAAIEVWPAGPGPAGTAHSSVNLQMTLAWESARHATHVQAAADAV